MQECQIWTCWYAGEFNVSIKRYTNRSDKHSDYQWWNGFHTRHSCQQFKKIQRSGQAIYASVLMKQFIVADTIIEVFDRYNICKSMSGRSWCSTDSLQMVLVQFHHGRSSWMHLRISRITFTIYANASPLCVKNYHTHIKRIPCLVGSGNEEILKITHNGIEKARDLFISHEESDNKIIIFLAVSSDNCLRNQIQIGV